MVFPRILFIYFLIFVTASLAPRADASCLQESMKELLGRIENASSTQDLFGDLRSSLRERELSWNELIVVANKIESINPDYFGEVVLPYLKGHLKNRPSSEIRVIPEDWLKADSSSEKLTLGNTLVISGSNGSVMNARISRLTEDGHLSHISRLSFKGHHLTDGLYENLISSHKFKHLTHLDVSDTRFSNMQLLDLMDSPFKGRLESLKFNNTSIDGNALIQTLGSEGFTSLKYLGLENLSVGRSGLEKLSPKVLPSLKGLNLSHNPLISRHLDILAPLELQELHLRRVAMRDSDLSFLIESGGAKSLHSIDISFNAVSIDGVRPLLEAAKGLNEFRAVEARLGPEVIELLAKGKRKWKALDLENNDLEYEGAILLQQLETSDLEFLNLSKNHITQYHAEKISGAHPLFLSLSKMKLPQLKTLHVRGILRAGKEFPVIELPRLVHLDLDATEIAFLPGTIASRVRDTHTAENLSLIKAPKLESISLVDTAPGRNVLKVVSESFPALRSFTMARQPIAHEHISLFASKFHQQLETLHVPELQLRDWDIDALFSYTWPKLNSLSLANNPELTDFSFLIKNEMHENLKSLDLSFLSLMKSQEAQKIFSLPWRKLQKLDLRRVTFSSLEELRYLTNLKSPLLRELRLSGLNIGEETFLEFLSSNWPLLKVFQYISNPNGAGAIGPNLDLSMAGMIRGFRRRISRVLPMSTRPSDPRPPVSPWPLLRELDLENNRISSSIFELLTAGGANELRSLNLSLSPISQTAFNRLITGNFPELRFLNMSRVLIGDDTINLRELAQMRSHKLKELTLNHNALADVEVGTFTEAEWPELRELSLSYNNLTDYVFTLLPQMKSQSIDELHLAQRTNSGPNFIPYTHMREFISRRVWPLRVFRTTSHGLQGAERNEMRDFFEAYVFFKVWFH